MAQKKRIKIFESFAALELDEIRSVQETTLQERFEAFWKMRQYHRQLFGDGVDNLGKAGRLKKRITFSKPEWTI